MRNIQQFISHDGALETLSAGRALTLAASKQPQRLRVIAGRLWLTRTQSAPAQSRDEWLLAGSQIELAPGESAVIEATSEARYVFGVVQAADSKGWRRLLNGSRKAQFGRTSLIANIFTLKGVDHAGCN